MSDECWTLHPSDFAFLWEECRRCFYLKVVSGFPRARAPMPRIFSVIDARMKAWVEGRRTETVVPGMPAGAFEHGERRVESAPLDVPVPDHVYRCRLRGALDALVRLDDGAWAVIDFKTAGRRDEHLARYARQLHAYAWALEQPAPGAFGVGPVRRLGLVVFEPEKFARDDGGAVGLAGGLAWLEVPRDDGAFLGFLSEVLSVLAQASPPGGAPMCPWCVYRDAGRRTGL